MRYYFTTKATNFVPITSVFLFLSTNFDVVFFFKQLNINSVRYCDRMLLIFGTDRRKEWKGVWMWYIFPPIIFLSQYNIQHVSDKGSSWIKWIIFLYVTCMNCFREIKLHVYCTYCARVICFNHFFCLNERIWRYSSWMLVHELNH